MAYSDRFFIGSLVSVAAVTFYVAPYEIVTKALIVPAAIVGVLFPAVASTHGGGNMQGVSSLLQKCQTAIFLFLLPVTIGVVALSREVLDVWIGTDYANAGYQVLQVLAVGVFFNGLAYSYSTVIQATGRADITGKLHMAELPVYILALWYAIASYGSIRRSSCLECAGSR